MNFHVNRDGTLRIAVQLHVRYQFTVTVKISYMLIAFRRHLLLSIFFSKTVQISFYIGYTLILLTSILENLRWSTKNPTENISHVLFQIVCVATVHTEK